MMSINTQAKLKPGESWQHPVKVKDQAQMKATNLIFIVLALLPVQSAAGEAAGFVKRLDQG